MPCDAIATATARIDASDLMNLVNMPQAADLLREILESQGRVVANVHSAPDAIRLNINATLVIVNLGGTVTTYNDDNNLSADVAGIMTTIAALQFQQRALDAIAGILPIFQVQATPENALVIATSINGLTARVILMPDGEIAIFTDEGTFAAGSAGIRQLFQTLSASIPVLTAAEPEQHRHIHAHGQLVHAH